MTFGILVRGGCFGGLAAVRHVRTEAAHLPEALWRFVPRERRPAVHHDHIGFLPRFARLDEAAQAPVSLISSATGLNCFSLRRGRGTWPIRWPETALRTSPR